MKNHSNENEEKTGNVLLHLFVSLPTDDVFSLRDISSTILVHQLKSKIELRVGIPGDLIHLFFMNKELLDAKPVREYKLKHGCILRVRLHKTWLGLFLACSKGDSYEVFDNGVRRMNQDLECRNPDVELWNKLVVKRATFALFMATHRGYLSLMLELLNSSAADINGSTIFGRTSLHIAAFQGFVGCVSLLLSEGALSSAIDIFGETPLQLAYVNRHVYCQKRLYLHQTSGCEELELSRRKIVDESGFPPIKQKDKTRKVIKVSQRPRELQNNKTQSLLAPVSGTPSISVDSGSLSQSHGLPVMKIIEPPKTNQPQDENYLPHEYPNLSASSEVQLKHNNDLQRNIPKAMRGIEGILRTSQDDVIGEYHNIEESMIDVNMTTIKLTLPREDINEEITTQGGNCEDQPEVNYDGHEDIPETHIGIQSSIQTKRILGLGLVLKTEETKGQEEKQSEQQENELLKSVGFDSETYSSTISSRRVTSLSYHEWLEKKRESGKLSENERPKSASTVRMKVGREMNIEAFQKWVNDKKRFRRRRGSESSATTERNRSSSGVSFEIWLSQKRQRGESFTGISSRQEQSTEKPDPRPKTANLGGKTFAEWLSEKQKGCQNGDSSGNSENKRNRTHSGKSFREWLKEKRKERQNDIMFRETSEIEKLQEKAFLEEQRRLNPRVKTFDEWLEEKRVQSFIEFVESTNAPEKPTLLNCKTKFPEDAELVFDMWLTSKYMEELSKEEERYEEMKEKWKKKEQERLQIRSGILQKLNEMKKEKQHVRF